MSFQRGRITSGRSQADGDPSEESEISPEERAKIAEHERKKAEVRRRLELERKERKKGFLTPERKKKLKEAIRKIAIRQLQSAHREQAEVRKKVIAQRCGNPTDIDGLDAEGLKNVLRDYHKRIERLEDEKYDLEFEVRQKEFGINELTIQVNELRGKFVRPTLKKVSKFDKLKIQHQKSTESDFRSSDFRSSLKAVKRESFRMAKESPKDKLPEWVWVPKANRPNVD